MGVGPLYVVIRVACWHGAALRRAGSTLPPATFVPRAPAPACRVAYCAQRTRVYGEYGAHVTLSTATHRSAALLPKAKRTNP